MASSGKPSHLRRVPDIRLSKAEAADLSPRTPLTEAEIAASIVGEDELKRLGRWGGAPSPRRRPVRR